MNEEQINFIANSYLLIGKWLLVLSVWNILTSLVVLALVMKARTDEAAG